MSFLRGLDEAKMTLLSLSSLKIGRGRACDRTGEGRVSDMMYGWVVYDGEREREWTA